MASPNSELGGDVHIPMCDKERCILRLQNLVKALEEKHLRCVMQYKLTGTFARWFKEAFENCPFTIIHRCRHLWNKISQFEKQLSDNDTKIVAVNLSTKSVARNEYMPRSESSFNNFFAMYSMSAITDEKSLNTFVLKVVQHFAESGVIARQMPDIISHQEKQNDSIQKDDHEGENVVSEEKFVSYPDLFGHNSVSVRESLMKCTEKEAVKFSALELHGWAEWRDNLRKEKCSPHSKFLIHKVLPELLEKKKITELAYIASCCDAVLQRESMTLLEHFLLSASYVENEFNLNTRIQLESLLFEGLVHLCDRFVKDEDKSAAVLIQRLTVLYIMVLGDMVMSCSNREQMKMCNMHLSTMVGRCSVLDPILNVRERCSTVEKVHELRVFIENLSQKECSIVKKAASKFIETNNPNDGVKLWKENSAVQACVIVEIMKQMFKSLNTKNLELLLHYVKKQSDNAAEHNTIPTACMTLLIGCLTIFIFFGLKKMKHQDLQLTSDQALKIISLYLTMNLTEDVYKYMQILLFGCSPVIQKVIFNGKCNVEGSMRKPYEKNQLPFLLNQLERLLSPLLLIEDTWKNKANSETEGKFELFHGTFDSHDVLLHVHCPFVKSHRQRNETGCNVSEDIFYNEMKMLQKLQHGNIVKVYAFHDGHIPQFYIVENHLLNNLQIALKYKRENKDLFRLASLIKFLVDTVAALEYCHSKLHVHCNLTAESLFIVKDSFVKLCGFHLCLELVDGRGKIDEQKIHSVPIRWTAPESLKDKEYTTASDIWMFGHLMYEVLSHGQLPYPHSIEVEDLSRKIIDGIISLPEEPCFRREHYSLISECTDVVPGNRPSLLEIRKQLDSFYIQLSNTEKPQAAVYSYDSYHKPSTENEKGIPDIHPSEYFEDQAPSGRLEIVAISDTIKRFTLNDKYIFREKIVHGKTQNMAVIIEDGKLNDILPGIKVCQNQGEALHIECHIPRSCQCSLLDLALGRTLGESLKPYLDCLLQVAFILEKLHERFLILGDMCASNLYVEHTDDNLKVYVVSLAYMLPWEIKVIPEDTHVCVRAAPEVISGGTFSPESDVYSFGYLVWEMLVAFDHYSHETLEQFMILMENTHSSPNEEYKKKVIEKWEVSHEKPHCCPDNLFNLITSCVNSASTRRITLNTVIKKLQRIIHDLNDEFETQDSVETSETQDSVETSEAQDSVETTA